MARTTEFMLPPICPMGPVKVLESCKKEATTPTVIPKPPWTAIRPPIRAKRIYWKFPIPKIIGKRKRPSLLAIMVFSMSSSLISLKSSLAASSWLKTLTTLRPSIISSM